MSRNNALLIIAVLAVVNYALAGLLGDIGFNVGRFVLSAFGGWYLVTKSNASLRASTLAGITVLVVDHIILKGGYFLIEQIFRPDAVQNKGLQAFAGVLISFIVFAPLAAAISVVGGVVARNRMSAR